MPSPALPRRSSRAQTIVALAGTLATAFALLVAGAPAASAHDALIASTPADGETLTTAPADLTLTYNAEIAPIGTEVVITAPDGTDVAGEPTVSGTDVVVPLPGDLAGGAYAIAWRVTSSDGHPIDGELTFTLDLPVAEPTPEPTPEPTTAEPTPTMEPTTAAPEPTASASTPAGVTVTNETEDSIATGVPAWVAVVIGLAMLGGIVALLVRLRRSQS